MVIKNLSSLGHNNISFNENGQIKFLLYKEATNKKLYMLFGEAAEITLDRRLFEVTEEHDWFDGNELLTYWDMNRDGKLISEKMYWGFGEKDLQALESQIDIQNIYRKKEEEVEEYS